MATPTACASAELARRAASLARLASPRTAYVMSEPGPRSEGPGRRPPGVPAGPCRATKGRSSVAKTAPRPTEQLAEKLGDVTGKMQDSQAWNSIFRPGSIFRKGYSDSPRNRSYVIMNSVLYHLHPVKVKRHAVKVSYTLCLGGPQLLPVHPADRHRHLPDVLLPADRGAGLGRHLLPADGGGVRPAGAEHAPMGGPPHGAVGVPAHGAGLLPRGLQATPGVQLGHRRRAADADPAALLHRLPAARGTSWPCGR